MAVGHDETRQSKRISSVPSPQPQPQPVALEGFVQVAAYVIATKEVELRLGRSLGLKLSVNADADFTAASNDRMSMSGISWKSSTQKCLTTATCEAEYLTFDIPTA